MITLQLTLLVLLLQQGSSKEPEPIFRPVGSVVELGYCISMDYMIVYRVVGEGQQLLSNSSDVSSPVTPPLDFQGRIHTGNKLQILSMQITNLIHQDSGIYRRECWKNHTLVTQHIQQLIVCDSEEKSAEIIHSEDRDREIHCNSTAIGQDGVSVRWYHEVYPSYTIASLLDSKISLDPVEGILEVRNNGATLVPDEHMLRNNQHFYCVVNKGEQCLSFQTLYMPESLENKEIFATHGDKVVLYCEADGNDQYWDTPHGKVDNVDERNHHMYISTGEESKHFSLVIHGASEEHFGDYSCVSSLYEMQYSLVFCSKKDSSEIFIFENQEVTLHCDIAEVDLYIVQWYRRQVLGQEELMYDSGDDSVPIPENLRGRIKVTDNHAKLTILRTKRADEGTYWCVVIKPNMFVDDSEEYEDGYDDEEGGDEESEMDIDWGNENKCLFKQETFLSVNKELSTVITPPTIRLLPLSPKSNGQAGEKAGVMLMVIGLATVFVLGKDR